METLSTSPESQHLVVFTAKFRYLQIPPLYCQLPLRDICKFSAPVKRHLILSCEINCEKSVLLSFRKSESLNLMAMSEF